MKKILALLLTIILPMTVIGCGNKISEQTSPTEEITDSTELLAKVWDSYTEDERFPISGGDYSNMVSDQPGSMDLSTPEDLDSITGYPAAKISSIDNAASMVHMMNANTFTAGAYHLTDSESLETIGSSIQSNIQDRQWICGFPEKLLIVSVSNDYIVSAFGNGEAVDLFQTHITEIYETANILVEEAID